ncbi:RNA 2',3'-cyclic phosphodiesterase [Alicyclobacillus fastidiosus]|uniref:RNA 2',3'-cyclic phosphodiesterase n=1 Tax=Alicyclobacillus fastidiosus TaxID=392011 RepID=A0ABY6ZD53_9BACL|nr:RNA 2',3'-cyclic phosphodiesterase [Alicyclobacillus fastidiosus]WAH40772.1 RNA 2',3'-cyclic phosphodiesterase [Alicyclobacillus fastidiosus]GMA62247.1 RNA 2',3'-cyclic phosphodiesterase [Alicyclobacillus fastidiosus]
MRRLFFGLELPDEWRDELHALQTSLKARHVEAGAWSNPKLLHITVLFLGMVSDEDEEAIAEAGRRAAEQVGPIRLTTGALGQFSRNKVFWLGLLRNETDWDKLALLNRAVKEQVLERLALDLDEKHYRPHITLARKLRSQVDVERLRAPAKLTTLVPNLILFESTRIDGQLQYPVRARFELRGPEN